MHPTILETARFHWPDEDACARWAAALAACPAVRRAFIALDGPLGAGKTTLVRHLLRALGVSGRVRSPTYTVMEPYALPARGGEPEAEAAHFDFYRFADPREWLDAGLREVFERPGLKLAEWPGQAGALLPEPDWWLQIEPDDAGARAVQVNARTPLGVELLRAFEAPSEPRDPAALAP